jgi:hypothetical protein
MEEAEVHAGLATFWRYRSLPGRDIVFLQADPPSGIKIAKEEIY